MIKHKQNESTAASASLHPKSRDYDDFEDDVAQAIEHYQSLNAKQKERYLEFLKTLVGSGTGIPPGANAPKNFNKEEWDWPTVRDLLLSENEFDEEMEQQLESMGFADENLQKAAQLFQEEVQARLDNTPFRQALLELLNDYTPSAFITDKEIDAVEMLANKILNLQDNIEYIERENATIVAETQNLQNLPENQNTNEPERRPKRSTIERYMLEADEANSDCLYNEAEQIKDARMRSYLKYFGE